MIATSRPGSWHRHLPGPPAAAAAGGRLRARPITSIPQPKAAPSQQEATPPERRPSDAAAVAPAPASPPPRHAGTGGDDVTHGSLPSPCPPPEAPPLPPSPPASAPRVITLVFPSGRSISAQRTALWNVSRVIRAALSQAPPQVERLEVGPWRRRVGGGVPEEEEDVDDPACWKAVVQMAEMRVYPPQLVDDWDSWAGLLKLAYVYDMPVVYAACAKFAKYRPWGYELSEPLTSPKNPLMAATLVERYCCGTGGDDDDPALGQLRDTAASRLKSALSCLGAWQYEPMSAIDAAATKAVASSLRKLIKDEDYKTAISPTVQAKVLDAILDSMGSL
ncbi:hypothetical protein GPECTOR_48g440 [Gonium pectorale]|uniref:Uncharacterized protein n=1 Tax=Gonium pectorale TaxID=33097 RepID=A0A150G862_GONPE|nr:hypothetical protein GPECTOR_48g440 [Gonium pectorale]|eukprot:KXZ46008.1 hypothetical protein GPECTOR_48g440 [Gonium pectorale]